MRELQGRKPKDRDFIRTVEGLLFCVVGYLHPPGRYTAYLKYAPASQGRWQRDGVHYHRVLREYSLGSIRETLALLEERYPHYVSYCPVRDMRFSMVPEAFIAEYCVPEVRLQEILAGPRDPLEEAVAGLAEEIAAGAGISLQALGVTGSILLGIHDPAFSDIDLTVYGLENALRVKAWLLEAAQRSAAAGQRPADRVMRLSPEETAVLRAAVQAIHPTLSADEVAYFVGRRWNYLRFGERMFSVHATRSDEEITETYGERLYRDVGTARIRARVVDVSEALFSPAIYGLDDVVVLEGDVRPIRSLISYDRIFADAVDLGAEIEAHGKVERVGEGEYRLVLGTTGIPDGGHLRPLRPKGVP